MNARQWLFLLVGSALPLFSVADETPLIDDTPEAACDVLKQRIAELSLPDGKPDRYWFCDFTTIEDPYVRIVALRSSQPRTDGATIYSNLIGWFAVARRSTLVLEWDVGEERLIPISSAYAEGKPHVRSKKP
jgi:hypothetical protein